MDRSFNQWLPRMNNKTLPILNKIFFSIVCFSIFYVLAIFVFYEIITYRSEKKDNKIILEPVGYIVYYIIICIGLSIVLMNLGIDLNSLFVILGSIGLTLGLALQTVISNIASGIIILILNYYTIGDLIEIGPTLGYVDYFDLFTTTIKDQNGVFMKIPNNTIMDGTMINYNKYENIVLSFVVSISSNNVGENYDKLINDCVKQLQDQSTYVTDKEQISITILDLSTSGTKLKINIPIKSRDYLDAKYQSQQIFQKLISDKKLLLLDNSYVKQ